MGREIETTMDWSFEKEDGEEVEVTLELTLYPYVSATLTSPPEGPECYIDNIDEIEEKIGRKLTQNEYDQIEEAAYEHETEKERGLEDAYWDMKIDEAREKELL